MKHPLRRGIVATAVVALGAGLLGAAPAAQAAPNSYAYSAARWLDDQLTDGVVHNEQYDFDDLGLTIDVFGSFAPDDRYAGATGKLASAVQEAGQDATSFGGVNLVQRAEERVVTEGTSAGRASDLSEYGDFSNTIGQAWVVRALSTASSSRAASTVEYLLKQQCADGGFRVSMADEQCGTPGAEQGPTVDATAFALQALGVAREHGISGLDDDVAEATDWLLRTQAADGSFSDGGTANTNSTGLAAATLRAVGQVGRSGAAASWIVSKQVTDAKAEDTALGNEIGAIAYDDAALQTGLEKGIPVEARDQWIRATAQAAVGVDAQLAGVVGVERVLGVDEGCDATGLLGVGHRVQRDRRLAGGLRAVDLDDAPTRQAADAERDVEGGGAGGDDADRDAALLTEAHDGALAVVAVDLGDRVVDRLLALVARHGGDGREGGLGRHALVRSARWVAGRLRR